MLFHGTLEAKFLAAEAVDTLGPVNFRPAVGHLNGLGGAYIAAFSTADADIRADPGTRTDGLLHQNTPKVP